MKRTATDHRQKQQSWIQGVPDTDTEPWTSGISRIRDQHAPEEVRAEIAVALANYSVSVDVKRLKVQADIRTVQVLGLSPVPCVLRHPQVS